MKKIISTFLLASTISFSGSSFAEDLDFSLPSNDDLFAMKDQVRTVDDTTKNAYRSEHQSRMMNMDQTERDSRFADMGASGKRNMDEMSQKNRSGKGKGNGDGSGKQKRKGQSSQSDGNQYRYGQANDSDSQSTTGGGGRYGGGRGRH